MEILSTVGTVLGIATAIFLAIGAIAKIRGTQEMVANFDFMKLQKYRVMVGAGELLGCILLVIPTTSFYGVLLITSFMSGAVSIHLALMGGAKVTSPIMIGVVAVVSYLLHTINF